MKNYLRSVLLAAALAALGPWSSVFAASVPVPYHAQEKELWCWAATSQMILEYFGHTKTQTELAAFGTGGVNIWNYLYGSSGATKTEPARKGIDLILKHFGDTDTSRFTRALTAGELDTEMTGSRPVIARLGWFDDTGNPIDGGSGHFVVIKAYDTGTGIATINDPGPDAGVIAKTYSNLAAGAKGVYSDTFAHRWTHSLTMLASIDLVFLIDTTGSMGDEINQVKTTATSLLDKLTEKFKDYRVAVVDYKDNPDGTHGDPSDWITLVRTGFTTNTTTVKNAINAMSAAGGADWPEAVYSALYRSITGSDPGAWRAAPVKRVIIIMGDAPGHFPAEPWAGGRSQAEVIAQAKAQKVLIQALLIAGDTEAQTDFSTLATGSGGSMYTSTGGDVAETIEQIVDDAAAKLRSPRGEIAELTPTFSFPREGVGMAALPKKTFLEMQRCMAKDGTCNPEDDAGWKRFKRVEVTDTETWTPSAPLPQDQYRWRLGNLYPASKIFDASGKLVAKAKGGTLYEENYTEFTRTDVEPGSVETIQPFFSFTASEKKITYQWKKGANATKYKVKITHHTAKGPKTRTKTVKPPKDDPDAAVLSITIGGHKVGESYSWFVQGLNYDHPK